MSALEEMVKVRLEALKSLYATLKKISVPEYSKKNRYQPPIWSGDLADLENFLNELTHWLNDPKMQSVVKAIGDLKQLVNDNRNFNSVPQTFLTDNYTIMNQIINALDSFESDFKRYIAQGVLEAIYSQGDVERTFTIRYDIAEELQKFKTSKLKYKASEMLKDSEISEFLKSQSEDKKEAKELPRNIQKFTNSMEMLKTSLVKEKSFLSEYQNNGSFQEVWNQADKIRNDLNEITFEQNSCAKELFPELEAMINEGVNSLTSGKNLTNIYFSLHTLRTKIHEWRENFNQEIEDNYNQIQKNKAIAVNKENDLESAMQDLKETFEGSKNLKDLCDKFSAYNNLINDIDNILRVKVSDEKQLKLLNNLNNVDGLIREMGDNFWVALKQLYSNHLVSIRIESEHHE